MSLYPRGPAVSLSEVAYSLTDGVSGLRVGRGVGLVVGGAFVAAGAFVGEAGTVIFEAKVDVGAVGDGPARFVIPQPTNTDDPSKKPKIR